MQWNMEVQTEHGLLRLMMKVPGTGFMQLLCLLCLTGLLQRVMYHSWGAMKARNTRRVSVGTIALGHPGNIFPYMRSFQIPCTIDTALI